MSIDLENRPHDSANILDYSRPDWAQQVDAIRVKLGSPNNAELFPPHFIKKTLPSIGGKVVDLGEKGAAFLFPDPSAGLHGFVARIHAPGNTTETLKDIESALRRKKNDAAVKPYSFAEQTSRAKQTDVVLPSGLRIQTPTIEMGEQIRGLQRSIWGVANDDFLYPADIHSAGFNLATTLIATEGSLPLGFLFGFHKYSNEIKPKGLEGLVNNWTLREESQLMGVLPEHRDHNTGFNLKRLQAQVARERGVEVINWTVDPLQAANAVLNINKLGGVVWEHHPDYYSFAGANALNQVVASRFSISWMVNSDRVRNGLEGVRSNKVNEIDRINSGEIPVVTKTQRKDDGNSTIADKFVLDADSSHIGIEIPVNWNGIQGSDLGLAMQWRNVTDEVFSHYIGNTEGKYVLSDVAVDRDGKNIKKVYLVGRKSKDIDQVYLDR